MAMSPRAEEVVVPVNRMRFVLGAKVGGGGWWWVVVGGGGSWWMVVGGAGWCRVVPDGGVGGAGVGGVGGGDGGGWYVLPN